jgi:hypothetical protein
MSNNYDIRERLGMTPVEDKLVQHCLRRFGHIQQKPPDYQRHWFVAG